MALPPGIYARRGPRGLVYQSKVQIPAGLRHLYDGVRQLSTTHLSVEAAVLWRLDVQRCHREARAWAPPRPGALTPSTIDAAMADWLRARVATRAPRTATCDAQSIEIFLDFLWERDPFRTWAVTDLSRDLLTAFFAWLRQTREVPRRGRAAEAQLPALERRRAVNTARKHVNVITVAWAWLVDSDTHGLWAPAVRLPEIPGREQREARAPTWAEWDRMLAALRGALDVFGGEWTWRAAVLARATARRRMALLHLDWSDVDLEAKAITWRGEHDKMKQSWRVPMPAWLAEEMAGWGVREGRVVGAPEAEFSGRGHVDRAIRRAWVRAGVDRSRWHGRPLHCARHTMETELGPQASSGALNWYIGHADPGVGPRTYRDRGLYAERLWPQLQALAEAVPPPTRPELVLDAQRPSLEVAR